MFKRKNASKAALSLEAALVMPIFLSFCFYLYLFLYSFRVDEIFQEAAYSSIKEAQLVSTIYQEEVDRDILGLNLETKLKDLLENGLDTAFLSSRQEYWLKQHISPEVSALFLQDRKYNLASTNKDKHYKLYDFSYTRPKVFGAKEVHYQLPLAIYNTNGFRFFDFNDAEEEGVEDNIWSEHQLYRGRYFRKEFGANLPLHFPTIAKFKNGKATSIKSIDLTAPSYQSQLNLSKKIDSYARKLEKFYGVDNWGQKNITIKSNEINSKELLLVIPENSADTSLITLKERKAYWAKRGIEINIHKKAKSRKYYSDED